MSRKSVHQSCCGIGVSEHTASCLGPVLMMRAAVPLSQSSGDKALPGLALGRGENAQHQWGSDSKMPALEA